MIYRSNLTAPDLTPYFKHLQSRPMGHSFGHDVPSDWADKADDDPVFGLYKQCGFLTHDEAAIVYNVAKMVGGKWLDIGSHTGWSTLAIGTAQSVRRVAAIDPMYAEDRFFKRAVSNLSESRKVYLMAMTSRTYFAAPDIPKFDGILIDGDHEPGEPELDAMQSAKHLNPHGVILFHDFIGKPVRDAVRYLMVEEGMKARVYFTPHVMACCWWDGNGFTPPDHIPDPEVKDQLLDGRMNDFDFTRCS